MLELRHVTKRYIGIPVVRDVSFTAAAGEVTGYLGPNGSGKSTTLKMITGLIEPSDGEILYKGKPIRHDIIAYRQILGYVPEEPHLYPHLSAVEYFAPSWNVCPTSIPLKNSVLEPQRGQGSAGVAERRSKKPLTFGRSRAS